LGAGAANVIGAATLAFDSVVSASQTVNFSGSGSKLLVGSLQGFGATLSGFDHAGAGSNDAVQLLGAWTEVGFSENAGGTLGTLTLSNGSTQQALKFAGSYASSDFHLNQGGGVTTIS
jgi:hypothetical protein